MPKVVLVGSMFHVLKSVTEFPAEQEDSPGDLSPAIAGMASQSQQAVDGAPNTQDQDMHDEQDMQGDQGETAPMGQGDPQMGEANSPLGGSSQQGDATQAQPEGESSQPAQPISQDERDQQEYLDTFGLT
jgi:hypothetical protein